MISVLLMACATTHSVALAPSETAGGGAPHLTTFGPVSGAADGQYSATPSIFRCVVTNGYVSVIQDTKVPVPAEMPRLGWCGEPEQKGSIPFKIATE